MGSIPELGLRALFEPDGVRLVKAAREASSAWLAVADRFHPKREGYLSYPGDNLMWDFTETHPTKRVLDSAERAIDEHVHKWIQDRGIPTHVHEWLRTALRMDHYDQAASELTVLEERLAGQIMLADPVATLSGEFPAPTDSVVVSQMLDEGRQSWFRRYSDEILAPLDRLLADDPEHSDPAEREASLSRWWVRDAIVEWWGQGLNLPLPFPVGSKSIRTRLEWLAEDPERQISWHVFTRVPFDTKALDEFAFDSSPFRGDVYAAGVVSGGRGNTVVDAFPLAARVRAAGSPDDTTDDPQPFASRVYDEEYRAISDVRFRLHGDAHSEWVPRFERDVRRWWGTFSGTAVRVGAAGPKPRSPHDIDELAGKYRHEREAGRARNQLEFATELGITDRQLRNVIGRWNDFVSVAMNRK